MQGIKTLLQPLAGVEAPSVAAAASAIVPAAQPRSVTIERPARERMAAHGRPPRPKAEAIDPMDPVSTSHQTLPSPHHICSSRQLL